jgi:hypothetical protein
MYASRNLRFQLILLTGGKIIGLQLFLGVVGGEVGQGPPLHKMDLLHIVLADAIPLAVGFNGDETLRHFF